MLALEFTGTAGSARNAPMLLEGKDFSDDDVAEKICLGIALATANAIRKAEITEIASVATSHRKRNRARSDLGTDERFVAVYGRLARDPSDSRSDNQPLRRLAGCQTGNALFLVFWIRLIFTARPEPFNQIV